MQLSHTHRADRHGAKGNLDQARYILAGGAHVTGHLGVSTYAQNNYAC
jgi:hypothetical protein